MTNFHMTWGEGSGCEQCFLGAGEGVESFLDEEEGDGEKAAAFDLDLEG